MREKAKSKILIVEDEGVVAKDIQMRLERLGYAVVGIAYSGDDAVETAGRFSPDLVLMDIKLRGDMDGIEAARQIRDRFNIPVIYLTAYTDDMTLKFAKIAEPYGYIVKPFGDRELHSNISMALYKHKAEKALRESENRYRAVIENATEGIVVAQDRTLQFVNPQFIVIMGYSEKELTSRPLIEFVHPDHREQVMGIHIKRFKGEEVPSVYEFRVVDKQGNTKWLESNGILIEWGDRPATLNFLRDITERKRADEALRESEERYRAIFAQAADPIVLIDSKTAEIVEFNDMAHENLGHTREEFGKLKISDLEVIESPEEILKHAEKVITEGADNFETKKRTKSGEVRDYQVNAKAITLRGRDFIQSIWYDTTERKKAEQAIQTLTESIAGTTGQEAFDKIVTNLCKWLDVEFAIVGQVVKEDQVNVLSMYSEGKIIHDYSYSLAGTPCDYVVQKGYCVYPENAHRQFPKDKELVELKAEGYVGIPLRDRKGRAIGVLCAISRQKLNLPKETEQIMRILASKASSEIERKKAEEAYRSLVDHSLQGLEIFQDGHSVFANQAMAEIIGYTVDEILAMSSQQIQAFVHPEDRALVWGRHQDRLKGKHPPERYEFRGIRKDGTICWLEIHASRIEYQGKPAIQAAYVDITERKRAEEEIIRAKEEWERTFMAVPDLIAIIDKQHRIVRVNKAMGEKMGVAPDEAVGMICYECIHGTKVPPNFCPHTKLLADGQEHMEEIYEEHLGGHFIVSVSPLRDDDGLLLGCVHIARDITERKKAEKEREATIGLLHLLNATNHIRELMKLVTTFLKDWSDCEAVGIRLQEGDDFSYFETSGFPEEFVLAENKLCLVDEAGELVRDSQGRPFLECMCGNIISGRFDPSKPFFTEHGSFWTNSTTELLAGTTEADRLARTRNRCNTVGYESLALVPLRAGKETFGLLQFNDKHKGRFTPEKISLLERLADNLAIGLAQRRAEQALRKSEEHLELFFSQSLDGFFFMMLDEPVRWDDTIDKEEALDYVFAHQRITKVNDAVLLQYGASREQFMGMTPNDLYAHDIAYSRDIWRDFFDAGRLHIETDERKLDGTPMWIEGDYICLYDSQGRITGHFGIQRDITERKKANEALHASEEQYRSLYESVHAGIVLQSVDGKIIHANKIASQVFGMTTDQIIGMTSTDPAWRMIMEDGTPVPGEDHPSMITVRTGKPVRDAVRGLFADDSKNIRWLHINTEPLLNPATGKMEKVMITFHDITERKKAEEALRESEMMNRSLLEGSPVCNKIIDLDFKLRYMSAAGLKQLKIPDIKPYYGQTYPPEFYPESMRAPLIKNLKQAMAGKISTVEAPVHDMEGNEVWYHTTFVPALDDDGRVKYVIGSSVVITERKKAEKTLITYQNDLRSLASKLTLIEEFQRRQIAADLHDHVSQTLALSVNQLRRLRKSVASGDAKTLDEVCQMIEKSMQNVQDLTFDLASPTLYKIGLEAAISELLSEQLRDRHGIACKFSDDKKDKPLDDNIRVLLFQAVRELLVNVIKHAKAHEVEVAIQRENDKIQISVSDDGVGFDIQEAETSIERSGGFGLFNIRERIDYIDGSFEIHSQPGSGSRFILTAPIKNKINL